MSPKAELIFSNAKAYTLDDANPQADTVAVSGGRILFVGSEADSRDLRSADTRMIDCAGNTLIPGIIDSHFHLFTGSSVTSGVQVRGVKNLGELRTIIRAHAEKSADEPWVMAYAASYALPSVNEPLTRQHLDTLIADKPLVLFAHDMHALWLNTAALKETGLLHGSDNPVFQEDMRFDVEGLATGEIVEVGLFVFAQLHLTDDETYRLKGLKRALKEMASFGITSVHNMLGDNEQGYFYSKLEAAHNLTCRVYLAYYVKPDAPLEVLGEAVELREQYESELLRAGAVKFFADGVYDGKTTLTLNGYPDDPAYLGESILEPEHYRQLVTEADRLGFQIATHAVGNGAVRLALDTYEHARGVNGYRDSRHRVEHIEVFHPDDIGRFAKLGVIASMQPLHAPSSARDADLWLEHVHKDEWPYAFAYRRLHDAGARLALGSDWPVVTMNPFRGWHAALNRQPWGDEGDGHYRQDLHEVLAGYTRDAAYTEFAENSKGQLKAGMAADIALLSADVFASPVSELKNLQADMTMRGGEVVFER